MQLLKAHDYGQRLQSTVKFQILAKVGREFSQKLIESDEANVNLNGFNDAQNDRISGFENPNVFSYN